jgi:hypothetical protein
MNASVFENVRNLVGFIVGANAFTGSWDVAIEIANASLTTPAFAHRLLTGSNNEPIPAEVLTYLTEVYDRNSQRNGRLLAQLEEAVNCLNSAGIVPLLLKGTVSLLSPGYDRGARLLTDLDLMVQPSELPQSLKVLRSIGYQGHSLGAARGCDGSDSYLPVVLSRPRDVGSIDIQCRFKGTRGSMDVFAVQDYKTGIGIGNAKAFLPSPTFQLAYLLLHDLFQDGDHWRGLIDLRHVLDISRLTRGDIRWALIRDLFSSPTSALAIESQFRMIDALVGRRSCPTFSDGKLARLQFNRKIFQLNYPTSRTPFTLLTVLLSWPPLRLPEGNSRTAFAEFCRLFRPITIGKV